MLIILLSVAHKEAFRLHLIPDGVPLEFTSLRRDDRNVDGPHIENPTTRDALTQVDRSIIEND
jgi:hypothetical protein